MALPMAEVQRVVRETRLARNAHARLRRAGSRSPVIPLRGLRLVLPGVVSWQRPREQPLPGGGRRTAYPPAYVAQREHWAEVVALAVYASGWRRPPVTATLCVTAAVVAPGKLDLDRVLTAVLDALQGGGALVDDCRCWGLYAKRRRPQADEAPHVDVLLTTLEGADG